MGIYVRFVRLITLSLTLICFWPWRYLTV